MKSVTQPTIYKLRERNTETSKELCIGLKVNKKTDVDSISQIILFMITIYKTSIQPHVEYYITIWGYAPKCQIQRVERLKNKIFRLIIRDYSWNTSPRDILSKFNIPSVSQRRDYFNCINVYRCLNGSFPIYICLICHLTPGILIHVLQAIPLIIISMSSGQGLKFIVSHFSIPVQ